MANANHNTVKGLTTQAEGLKKHAHDGFAGI